MSWRPPRGALAELTRGAEEDCARRRTLRPGLVGEVHRAPAAPRRGFARALADVHRPGFPLICEVKRASPSQGVLRADLRPAALAAAYVEGGARCVSVLTEGRRFGGSLEDLRAVRASVDVPLLRKDFIVDPYMVYEALEAGADCILLIAGALEPVRVHELGACARELGLDVLLELVDERELPVLDGFPAALVGVNARDLETLEVDADRFARLAPMLKAPGRTLVAESGVRTPADVVRLALQGAGAALVGESLVRALDARLAVKALVEATWQ